MNKTALSTVSRNEFLESLYAAVPDVILTTDEEGVIETCNRAVEEMFGFRPEEIEQVNLAELIAEPNRDEYRKSVLSCMKTGEAEGLRVCRRVEGRKRDGSFFPISITGAEIPHKGVKLYTYAIRDITKILEAERELEKLTRDLARSNAELKRFASVVSHDLQAPLRTIAVFSESLSSKWHDRLDEDSRFKLDRVVKAADRMRSQMANLLTLAQVSSKTAHERVNTDELCEEVVSDLAALIEECGAKITHDELPAVSGNRSHLRQLFQNLIGNAIKFHRPGMPPEVRLSAEKQGDAWAFSICDNGIGIPVEQQERIFEVFHRLHASEYPGSGLGLAICKQIVDAHGGRIEVGTSPAGGARFTFTLNRAD